LALAACAPEAPQATSQETAAPQSEGAFMRGAVLPGEELRFRACGQQIALPLNAVDLVVDGLVEEITEAGEPIYTEFAGRVGGRVPGVTMTRLYYATRDSVGCRAASPEFEFQAQGNEPFWNVELAGEHATWRQLGAPDAIGFAVTEREFVGDGLLLTAVLQHTTLKVAFAATACRDSMADAWYGYTVQAETRGQRFHGCGRRGTGTLPPLVVEERP